MAIAASDGKRECLYIPAEAIVKIVSGPTSAGDRMVDVLWDGKIVTMFAIDVDVRGAEVMEDGAGA